MGLYKRCKGQIVDKIRAFEEFGNIQFAKSLSGTAISETLGPIPISDPVPLLFIRINPRSLIFSLIISISSIRLENQGSSTTIPCGLFVQNQYSLPDIPGWLNLIKKAANFNFGQY